MREMQPNLEQLAQTTEPQMVRSRFDEQNLGSAYVISWLFAATSVILVPISMLWKQQRFGHGVAAVFDALFILFIIAAMSELRRIHRRDSRPPRAYARLVGRHLSGWLITLYVVKFATLIYFALSENSGWIAWGVIFHLGHEEQVKAFASVSRVLRADAPFLFTAGDVEDVDGGIDFPMNGVTFHYYSFTVDAYRSLLHKNGLRLVDVHKDRGENVYYLARKST